MNDTPFDRVTRSVRWLRFALFGVVPVLLVLAGGMYWGYQRILSQQQERVYINSRLVFGYVSQHERLLRRLQEQNAKLAVSSLSPQASLRQRPFPGRAGTYLFQGLEQGEHLPFALVCASADCPRGRRMELGVGQYLSNTYTTFWATSSFPPGEVFLVDRGSSVRISAPGINVESGFAPLTPQRFLAVTDRIHAYLGSRSPSTLRRRGPVRQEVHWLVSPQLPDAMIGVIRAPIHVQAWNDALTGPPDVHAATLLSFPRIALSRRLLGRDTYDDFWLGNQRQGLLVGRTEWPDAGRLGLTYTRQGLVYRFEDPSGQWWAGYRVGYRRLFSDNWWLPVGALLFLVLGVGGAAGFARWYNRRVLEPASAAQREIVESEQFNRTLVATAPVALCVLARGGGEIVFGNRLAMRWLGMPFESTARDSATLARLRNQLAGANGVGTLDFAADDGRPLQVVYALARYQQRDVILCAFTDISAHAEIERTLARAKQEADRASAAKSTFLATMSHEIRTPMYGVLGTLELLELTPLDDQQRQHLDTIKSSSNALLQIISDVLDISRIESGQLALVSEAFSPRHLVEDTVAAYAATAWKKQLPLFACVDPRLPPMLRGDPARIRQILSNLIGNAIKFTGQGHVIVRAMAAGERDGRTVLRLQVEDTGIGIAQEEQARLFAPFQQVDAGSHTVRGTGLGLSICAQLAERMDSRIELDSAPHRGSRFALELALPAEPGNEAAALPLSGARVQVRSGHPELTDHLCQWFRRLGAQAEPAATPPAATAADEVLVDVLLPPATPASQWRGPQVVAAGVGEAAGTAPAPVDGYRLDAIVRAIAVRSSGREPVAVPPPPSEALAPLRMHVLIADDNPINRATLTHQLEQLGCTVVATADGVQALAQWREQRFDAVLTDVNMPNLDGYGLARRLRGEGATVPIIGITANAMREEEQRCRDAGMDAWLVKPIGLRTLARCLREEMEESAESKHGPDIDETLLPPKFRALFVEAMQADVAQVRRALAEEDDEEVAQALHRMRGAMSMMRWEVRTARLETLEARIQDEGLAGATGAEVESVLAELETALARL